METREIISTCCYISFYSFNKNQDLEDFTEGKKKKAALAQLSPFLTHRYTHLSEGEVRNDTCWVETESRGK